MFKQKHALIYFIFKIYFLLLQIIIIIIIIIIKFINIFISVRTGHLIII